MSAIVIILPEPAVLHFNNQDWEEQHVREVAAKIAAMRCRPPRTRPLLVTLRQERAR